MLKKNISKEKKPKESKKKVEPKIFQNFRVC
jgi:hypothetical protein